MAWREGYVDYSGKHFQYRNLQVRPEPVQDPVPIHIASVSPETFQMVRDSGCHIMGSLLTNPRGPLIETMATYRATLPKQDRGRIRTAIMAPVYVGDSNDAAFREAMPEIAWFSERAEKLLPSPDAVLDDSYAYFRKLAQHTSGCRDAVARAMAAWPIGDVDRVTRYFVDLVRGSGCDEIVCSASVGAMEFRNAARNLERLASEVMPLPAMASWRPQ